MFMIKSYVINLERNPDRMQFIQSQLEGLGLDYERFPAVDGKSISDQAFEKFANDRPRGNLAGRWTKGKMGCDLSHYELWKIGARSPDPFICILEDDVYMSPDVKQFLKTTDWIPSDADIIRLEGTTLMKCNIATRPVQEIACRGLYLMLPNKFKNAFSVGAGAYVIRKEAAQKLLEAPIHALTYVDRALFDHVTSGIAKDLVTYQVKPALVVQDKFLNAGEQIKFNSEIETEAEGDIYINSNIIKRYLRKYGIKVGAFQLFSILRKLLYKISGYQYIDYKE